MSKRRPSKASRILGVGHNMAAQGHPPHAWLWRVFHNTYTRGGRRIPLRGWSVKLQRGGQRHTFSLVARTRRDAATEAQAIQEAIGNESWEAVIRRYSGRGARTSGKANVRYWRKRLVLRNYPTQASGGRQEEFSTYIEHADTGWYFPLGSSNPETAAARGLTIYRRVIREGWRAVEHSYARELTVAFHWGYNPLLWTYTTIHTQVEDVPRGESTAPKSAQKLARILLVESDPRIRGALAQCINQDRRCYCVACPNANSARRHRADGEAALCLFNRGLTDTMGLAKAGQIGTLPEGAPAVSYEVHSDSEELFALTPGGASAYVLKRTAPEHLLEPVIGVLTDGSVTAGQLSRGAQAYFRRLLQIGPSEKPSNLAQLTQREQDVLNLMSKGYLDKEIAPTLGISTWTVHEHVKRIFDKLRVHSRTEAVLAYLQK